MQVKGLLLILFAAFATYTIINEMGGATAAATPGALKINSAPEFGFLSGIRKS